MEYKYKFIREINRETKQIQQKILLNNNNNKISKFNQNNKNNLRSGIYKKQDFFLKLFNIKIKLK